VEVGEEEKLSVLEVGKEQGTALTVPTAVGETGCHGGGATAAKVGKEARCRLTSSELAAGDGGCGLTVVQSTPVPTPHAAAGSGSELGTLEELRRRRWIREVLQLLGPGEGKGDRWRGAEPPRVESP
jgi:hypothetical protein